MDHSLLKSLTLTFGFLLLATSPSCSKNSNGADKASKSAGNQSSQDGPSLQGEVKKESRHRVQVAPVVKKEMVRTLTVTRAVESEFEIDVLPRTTGTIVSLDVDEGDWVTTKQVLAKLDAREAQSALADKEFAVTEARNAGPRLSLGVREAEEQVQRAKLTHEQSEREYTRNKSAGFVSSSDLEKLELTRDQAFRDWQASILTHESAQQELENQGSVIDRALLAVEKAKLDLSYQEITAPFDGIIAERMVNIGASVGPSAGAFKLTDPKHLRAILHRPQRELTFFQEALALQAEEENPFGITIRPEAYPDTEYAGSIRRVSPVVDAASGSIRVTIDIEQPEDADSRPPLLPGMLVRLSIVTERRADALTIQKRAMRREGERRYVFVVREGVARRVEVKEGLLGELEVEVTPLEGYALSEGEPVVTIGGRDLEDGKSVQIAEPKDTEPNGPAATTKEEETAASIEGAPASSETKGGPNDAEVKPGSTPKEAEPRKAEKEDDAHSAQKSPVDNDAKTEDAELESNQDKAPATDRQDG